MRCSALNIQYSCLWLVTCVQGSSHLFPPLWSSRKIFQIWERDALVRPGSPHLSWLEVEAVWGRLCVSTDLSVSSSLAAAGCRCPWSCWAGRAAARPCRPHWPQCWRSSPGCWAGGRGGWGGAWGDSWSCSDCAGSDCVRGQRSRRYLSSSLLLLSPSNSGGLQWMECSFLCWRLGCQNRKTMIPTFSLANFMYILWMLNAKYWLLFNILMLPKTYNEEIRPVCLFINNLRRCQIFV